MKRVCIHQPDFAPWLGFFQRLTDTDVFILLDDVQFLRRGWHHRDKIKTNAGAKWLTLAVEKGPRDRRISDVPLGANPSLREKNLQQLTENYRHAAHFDNHIDAVNAIFSAEHDKLVDINAALLHLLLSAFDIDVQLQWSSSLAVGTTATERLVDLVQRVDGTHYVTGTGALDYLDQTLFEQAGITLEVQSFEHPSYPQLHGDFIPMMSSLDALFNCGDSMRDLIR